MSTDFYVAVPHWPTAAEIQQCMVTNNYPIVLKRFPAEKPSTIVSDGILAKVGAADAYLEGDIYPAVAGLGPDDSRARVEDVKAINDKLASTGSKFRIDDHQVLLSMRIGGSFDEFRAVAYISAALIKCFKGHGYEPQGDHSGEQSYAEELLAAAKMVEKH